MSPSDVNTLMGNWDILTAEKVTFPECTEEICQFLNSVTPDKWLDKCFARDTWPQLRFFALVIPNDDILPVRTPFDAKDREHWNIADCRFSSEKPVWFAGPDIVLPSFGLAEFPKYTRPSVSCATVASLG